MPRTLTICGATLMEGLFARKVSSMHLPAWRMGKGMAYTWLPPSWTGYCYLAYIIPHKRHLPTLDKYPSWTRRNKHAITETERFFMIAFPIYGSRKAARELINMA
eukprot:g30525.t1